MTALEWRNPAECNYGKCEAGAVVDVTVQGFGSVEGGSGARACAAHVGPVAELVLARIRDRLERAVAALEPANSSN